MPQPASPISTLYRIEARPDGVALVLAGDWGASAQLPTTQRIVAEVLGARTHDAAPVVIDGTELASAHPRVAAVVYGVNEQLRMRSVEVRYEDLPDSVHALVTLARPAQPEEGRRDRAHWLNRLGKRGGRRVASVADTAELIGNAFAATPKLAVGKAQARWVDFMALIRETGAASLPVVTVVNLLIGAVLGFVGAVQLATFGAGLYLADLVGIAVAREMAAIMTAFIMAGRIGATFAAQFVENAPGFFAQQPDNNLAIRKRRVVIGDLAQARRGVLRCELGVEHEWGVHGRDRFEAAHGDSARIFVIKGRLYCNALFRCTAPFAFCPNNP